MTIPEPPSRRIAPPGSYVALAWLTLATIFAADPAPLPGEQPAAPKTHVLFMGADVTVERNKEFLPVENVTATHLIIKSGGKPVQLPLSQAADLQINETLKVAGTSVGIDHLEWERAYSIGADPFDQLAKSVGMAAGQSAEADLAAGAALNARMQGLPTAGGLEDRVAELYNTPPAQIYDTVAQSVKAGGAEMFDAIRLSFEVIPKKNLTQPYCVIIAQIRDRDSKPGQARKWAYVQSLDPISAGEVRNVLVYRGGFPPGYILETCEVHLYDRGEELATNLSRKRVPLTDDEAQEYRIIEYISANKGRTRPAALATTTITGAARFSLTKAQLDEIHYVRVAKDGSVMAAFRDAAGKQALQDPPLEAALRTLRFKPALAAGKPVESIAPVNLGQLATPL